MYEINPYIQTSLDARPHHIGTYVLDPLVTVESEFVDPEFKKLVLPLNAYIFSLTWSDYVASDFIYVSFYKHITSQNNLNTISYLLTDKSRYFNIFCCFCCLHSFNKIFRLSFSNRYQWNIKRSSEWHHKFCVLCTNRHRYVASFIQNKWFKRKYQI